VESAWGDVRKKAWGQYESFDIVVMSAAVADYTAGTSFRQENKKGK
jgi:phosphopantothenoylcysteine synthetase/decarboxylase